MQLYTVILQNKQMISKFDAKGRKIAEIETWLEQTIRDLPLQTAQMYQRTDTTGKCKVVAQEQMVGGRSHDVRFGDQKYRAKRNDKTSTSDIVRTKKAKAPVESVVKKAARTGDMSAAISEGA